MNNTIEWMKREFEVITWQAVEIEKYIQQRVAAERNACADLLEYGLMDDEGHHIQYAAAIRARGGE